MTMISGWGRFPVVETEILTPSTYDAAQLAFASADGSIVRGNGRAYGDAAIGARQTVGVLGLDRFRHFDSATGKITVEAGVLLDDLIATFGPKGYFPYVVPGTRFVTVGGAIAADVHGKNHHRDGGFSQFVESFLLATAGGKIVRVARDTCPELFFGTVGGMGLTGAILEATLHMRRVETGWIRQQTIVASDLVAAIAALDDGDSATYSVAWIDCLAKGSKLGRSLVFLGEHASRDQVAENVGDDLFPSLDGQRVTVPIDVPQLAVNNWSVSAFNEAYFRHGAWQANEFLLLPSGSYFFPLDRVGAWNRIYGRKGFIQHQCVLPLLKGPAILAEMIGRIAARGEGSFLAVLKKLGQSFGIMSFPVPGYTLALDFPVKAGLLEFLDELDELVVEGGGRIYLAKDARQSRGTFEAGYPNISKFRDIRRGIDATNRIRSRLAERLDI